MYMRLLCSSLALLLGGISLAHAAEQNVAEIYTTDDEHEELIATPEASSGSCGVERWSVKTGTDADSGQVNLSSMSPQTIVTMRSWTAPNPIPPNNRVSPYETTQWVMNATLVEYKLETDSDYHLVIEDASGNTMIAEIPDPACVGAGSPFASGVQNARSVFDAKYNVTTSFQTANIPVQITGVGMFDFLHGQTGVAPNGIEIHPVLNIVFNPGNGNPDFALSAAPGSVTATQGSSATSAISITPSSGFTGNVSFTASGLPSGVTASFSPTSSSTSTTLTLTASSTAATGTSAVTVTGTSGSLIHTAIVNLTVNAAGSGGGGQTAVYNSTLKAPGCATVGSGCDSGPSLLLGRGSISGGAEPNQPNTINNSCADGTSGAFHTSESLDRLAIATTDGSNLTAGKSVKITATVWAYSTADALDLYSAPNANSPTWTFLSTITPSATGAQTLSTSFTLPSGSLQAIRGNFRYQGSASSCSTGAYDDHDDLIFAVAGSAPSPDFAISDSPSALSVTQGATANDAITITPQNGFTGSVSFSASGLPSGVTASFSPTSSTTGSTVTFTASSTATTGTSTVTITGTSGSLTHSTTVALTVAAKASADFSLSSSPSTLSVTQGTAGSSTVTVNKLNGFSGSVSLTASGLPSGVTASFNPASTTSTSTLTLTAAATAATGTSTVTITGTSGSLTHSTTLSLTVNASGTSTQLLANTGIESTLSPWTGSSGIDCSAGCSGESAHAGTGFAWLNGYGSTHTDTLSQSVTIPAGKTSATLQFYLHVDTAETSTTTAYDKLTVKLGSTTVATFSNLNAATGYQVHSYNVTVTPGSNVTLTFTGTEDSSLQTSFVIDDVTLTVH